MGVSILPLEEDFHFVGLAPNIQSSTLSQIIQILPIRFVFLTVRLDKKNTLITAHFFIGKLKKSFGHQNKKKVISFLTVHIK